jgi:DNA-binding GntR family transcriptional regulator
MITRADILKPTALNEWAYEKIKADILSLRLAPGEQLNIENLTEQLEISRTPIREAILMLERDGLVNSVSRVGFFVTEITEQDLKDLFELREWLECQVAQKAASRLTDADLERIDHLIQASIPAVEKGDLDKFLDVDIELHNLLLERANNRRLIVMMETIRDLTYRERALSVKSPENIKATLVEHQELAAALRNRDGVEANRLMKKHLGAVRDRVLQILDRPSDAL